MKMNEKKKQELKKKLAEVPNPPVPNRAHTEMTTNNYQKNNCKDCNNKKQRKD